MSDVCPACGGSSGDSTDRGWACAQCEGVFEADQPTAITLPTRLGGEPVARRSIALTAEFRERYLLGRLLGRGATGVVYAAIQRSTRRAVAVKFLAHVDDDEQLERFAREGRLLGRLQHPGVVRIYDVDRVGAHPFLVTELLGGGTLRARIQAAPRGMPVPEALGIADELLAGLGACHELGIVHRDVKPANVLFGEDGQAKLADLGIAKVLGDPRPVTIGHALIGTPRYMAPEQVLGGTLGPATDVYAAACVLYEMLAGRPAFRGTTVGDLMREHLEPVRTPLPTLRPDVPPHVAEAVDRALATDPSGRPASAAAFRQVLTTPRGVSKPRAAMRVPAPAAPPPAARARAERYGGPLVGAMVLLTLAGISIATLVRQPSPPPAATRDAAAADRERLRLLADALRRLPVEPRVAALARSPNFQRRHLLAFDRLLGEGFIPDVTLDRIYGTVLRMRATRRPARFREEVARLLASEPCAADVRWWRARLEQPHPLPPGIAADDPLLGELTEGLQRLAVFDAMVHTQYEGIDLGLAALLAPLVVLRHELPAPAPPPPGIALLPAPHVWMLREHTIESVVGLWITGLPFYRMAIPDGPLDPAVAMRGIAETRAVEVRSGPHEAAWPGGQARLSVDVAHLGPGHQLELNVGGSRGRSATLVLGMPGEESWLLPMDGWPLSAHPLMERSLDAGAPARELHEVRPDLVWGRLSATLPAARLPAPPWKVTVRYRILPGLEPTTTQVLPRGIFTRNLTLELTR